VTCAVWYPPAKEIVVTPEEDRYYVLGNVLEGLARLEACDAFASVIPEVRSNLVMALATAIGPEDVVGIPGRITNVQGKPRAAGRPALGGSYNTARIVLAVRRELPNLRAGLELKYRPDLVRTVEREGLLTRSLEPVLSGAGDRDAVSAGLRRTFRETYSEEQRLSVAYTEGGHSREGAIILLGETAVDVAEKAIAIAKAYEHRVGRGSEGGRSEETAP
jgi:predicted fused transcriptional regulator/phosphomethylpyrimidine kinase